MPMMKRKHPSCWEPEPTIKYLFVRMRCIIGLEKNVQEICVAVAATAAAKSRNMRADEKQTCSSLTREQKQIIFVYPTIFERINGKKTVHNVQLFGIQLI